MQGLPILIRLARRRADEHRAMLAEAERQALLAAEMLASHDLHLRQQTALVRGQAEAMAAWSDWSRVAIRRQRQLQQTLVALRAQEEQIRDALREDFAEIKRLEIAHDAATGQARRQAARRAERMAEDAALRRMR